MITGEIRSKIDRIWDDFWSGGISNPLSVIEQITYLLFIKRLDEIHTNKEAQANISGTPIENPIFPENQQELRWSKFKHFEPSAMHDVVSKKVFPFIKNLHANKSGAYSELMKDALYLITNPQLLSKAVDKLSDLPMESRDLKGDIYEYLLANIAVAGKNGQFRTPRHIINMMVEMVKPQVEDTICDPASGTCGFLVGADHYLRKHHPEVVMDTKLSKHYHNHMFSGNDFDMTMMRIGAMNLMLHGIEKPNLTWVDGLSGANTQRNKYSLILANPPFKGSLDYDSVAKDLLNKVTTKKTELLFISLFIHMLQVGGRCACIVPDGVLFGSSKAHKAIRKELIEKQKLIAVISMPSGVFKPYAGVSTAVLYFHKTDSGGTENVWFYDMHADGYSLDDKRARLEEGKHENDNIPDIIARIHNLDAETSRKRTDQSFFVPAKELIDNGHDLSINRYKEIVHEAVNYDPPKKIIADLKTIENEILENLHQLSDLIL